MQPDGNWGWAMASKNRTSADDLNQGTPKSFSLIKILEEQTQRLAAQSVALQQELHTVRQEAAAQQHTLQEQLEQARHQLVTEGRSAVWVSEIHRLQGEVEQWRGLHAQLHHKLEQAERRVSELERRQVEQQRIRSAAQQVNATLPLSHAT